MVTSAALLMTLVNVASAMCGEEAAPVFENTFGWEWAIQPNKLDHDRPLDGDAFMAEDVMVMLDVRRDGALRAVVVKASGHAQAGRGIEYQPIALDAVRKAFAFDFYKSYGNAALAVGTFQLPAETLAFDKLTHVGLEKLTPDGRKRIAEKAQREAKKAGVEFLPFPEIDQAFDFALTTIDGKKIKSSDYRGKVLFIDCWATWCRPCMDKMPDLKELYTQWHDKGLEIVGVTFDQSREEAEAAIKKLDLRWPQVQIPSDEKPRDLWHDCNGIKSIPRLFLIDREGILRADLSPYELKERVDAMMSAPAPSDTSRP